MKKYILFVFMIAVIGSLVFVPGCKRSDLADPDMHNNAGYFINLSGTSNPSTLFIPTGGQDSSNIHLLARFNTGEPIVGREILLKLNEDIGYFPNEKRYITLVTNSQGRASTIYTVKHFAIDLIGSSKLINIAAHIMSDLNPIDEYFHENIPILLLTTFIDEEIDTLHASQTWLPFTIAGGSYTVNVSNLTQPDNPISYTIYFVDPWIIITGFDGETPDTLTITVGENTGTERYGDISLTATNPDVLNSPITITVYQDGT